MDEFPLASFDVTPIPTPVEMPRFQRFIRSECLRSLAERSRQTGQPMIVAADRQLPRVVPTFIAALAVFATVAGCTSIQRHSGANSGRRSVARDRLTGRAPIRGYATAPSRVPVYHAPTPGLSQNVIPVVSRGVSDEQLIAAWDIFGDPRLRYIQSAALRNSPTRDSIAKRFVDAKLPEAQAVPTNLVDAKHFYMITLAREISKARYHQHRILTITRQLERQRDGLEQARIRVEVGSATRGDILQLVSRAQQTEAMLPGEIQQRDVIVAQIEPLIGRVLTQSLIDAMGDQPALTLPEIQNSIAAKRLQDRCDVHSATQHVRRFAIQSGITDAELLPALALKGFIRVDEQSGGQYFDPQALSWGNNERWDFAEMGNGVSLGSNLRSPVQQAMGGYHQTVNTAASEVKRVLSDYVLRRNQVEKLVASQDSALDALRRTLSLFDVGRAAAGDVVNAQTRVIEVEIALHEAELELALVAIDLFVALGGPCHANEIAKANYYEPMS